MAAPSIVRTQHKLGDYLFEPDLAKFNLPKKSSRPWIINNAFDQNKDQVKPLKNVTGMEKVNNSINVTVKCSRTSPSPTNEEISNTKFLEYTRGVNDNQKSLNTSNIIDNERFCSTRKSFKSPKVKSKMNTKHPKNKGHLNQLYNKNTTQSESQPQNKNKEGSARMAMDTAQDTQTERVNFQKIQQDKELEYQNQINQMYNDPQYMDQLEQYYQPVQPQPAFHHTYHENPMAGQILFQDPMFSNHVVQQPPMYFIAMPPPLEDPTPMTMTPDTGSDYSSEDGSCYELNVSSDSSDDEVFETNLHPTAFTDNFTGVPKYKEPDYEIPIEMDEELNMLVLSIIDD